MPSFLFFHRGEKKISRVFILNGFRMLVKKVWCYWHAGEANLPAFEKSCLQRLRVYNPGWTLQCLDREQAERRVIEQLPSCATWVRRLTHQLFSDLLRIVLLVTKGGMWLDVSVVVRKPLDSWLSPKLSCDGHGFKVAHTTLATNGTAESWFLAVNAPGCPFLRAWLDAFSRMLNEASRHPEFAMSASETWRATDKARIPMPLWSYLAFYVAFETTRQKLGETAWQDVKLEFPHLSWHRRNPFFLALLQTEELLKFSTTDRLRLKYLQCPGEVKALKQLDIVFEPRLKLGELALWIVAGILSLVCLWTQPMFALPALLLIWFFGPFREMFGSASTYTKCGTSNVHYWRKMVDSCSAWLRTKLARQK